MITTDQRISGNLKPFNFGSVSSSAVVDIYPVPTNVSFIADPREQSIPPALSGDFAKQYHQALPAERDFLARKHGEIVPQFPHGADLDAAHKFFADNKLGLLGLRNILLFENNINAEYCVVPHPAYRLFCQERNTGLHCFGSVVGAALMLVTADDKIIIQHRNPENRVYGDVPGASAAGLIDVRSIDLQAHKSIDVMKLARAHLLREGREEIGLSPSVTESFAFTSIQIDKRAIHHELTFYSRTALTSEEIINNSFKADGKSFGSELKENFVVLDATPEVISDLLVKLRTPFPMSHAGPLLMLGLELIKQRGATPADATSWLTTVQAGMDANYAEIDLISISGRYSPLLSATSQQLPRFENELERLFSAGSYQYIACGWHR